MSVNFECHNTKLTKTGYCYIQLLFKQGLTVLCWGYVGHGMSQIKMMGAGHLN